MTEENRPVVGTPEQALAKLAEDYPRYRRIATFAFKPKLKEAALSDIDYTLAQCKRAVEGSRKAHDESATTRWRKIAEFLEAQHYELRMWLFLNRNEMHAAWESLISGQTSAHWAARWLPEFEPAEHLNSHLADVERVIFPKQQFLSPSLIIDEGTVECSICHSVGHVCDHIAGEIYNGEVAANIIHGIEGVREVSFVDEPANKHARAFRYGNIDPLTGEDVGASPREADGNSNEVTN
ncbi:MAG TPA: hypothetical protein VMT95_15605 [Candidatus Binatia bacterium]|nr:hypothetical protein [Candidatus Binatia bacterium]